MLRWPKMGDSDTVRLLTEIREEIKANNTVLSDVKTVLQNDRNMMWKLLMLVIGGAFALIGYKMALP
jgi:hypothetical protein